MQGLRIGVNQGGRQELRRTGCCGVRRKERVYKEDS
jgi:hypothetical protein